MAVSDLVGSMAGFVDAGARRVVGHERTRRGRAWCATAYREQPLVLGLVVTWTAFVAVPVAVFVVYAALWAAVVLGMAWTLFVFWSGLGLVLVLVPVLCVATVLAVGTFVAAAAAYYVVGARVLAALGYKSLYDVLGQPSPAPRNVVAF